MARIVHPQDSIPGAHWIGIGSMFENPFYDRADLSRSEQLILYRQMLMSRSGTPSDLLQRLPMLRGKVLCCWCRHDGELMHTNTKCHGDILIDLLERYADDELFRLGREGWHGQ